jgi:hypothetical protein
MKLAKSAHPSPYVCVSVHSKKLPVSPLASAHSAGVEDAIRGSAFQPQVLAPSSEHKLWRKSLQVSPARAICSKKMILPGPGTWAVQIFGGCYQQFLGARTENRRPVAQGHRLSHREAQSRRGQAARRAWSVASVTSILPRGSNRLGEGLRSLALPLT